MEVSDPLSDEDIVSSLRSIIEMANEPFMEAQLEAARMLCDLSQHEDMQQALRESGGIEVLVRLLNHGFEWCRQHAVLALANLSSAQCCQVGETDTHIYYYIINSHIFIFVLGLYHRGWSASGFT